MKTLIFIAIFFSVCAGIKAEKEKPEESFRDRIWNLQHTAQKDSETKTRTAKEILTNLKNSENQQKKAQKQKARTNLFYLLSLAISNFPGSLFKEVRSVYNQTTDKELFAMAARYLILSQKLTSQDYLKDLANRFHISESHAQYPCFSMAGSSSRYVSVPKNSERFVPEDLYIENTALILVLLPGQSDLPGSVLLIQHKESRSPEVIDLNMKVLGYTFSGMPYCFSEGNTPGGLYYFDTIETSMNPAIGKTKAVKTRMPFEANAADFSRGQFQTWNAESYVRLFPKALQVEVKWSSPYFQAYKAGAAGRHLIYLHGSGLDANNFKEKSYYPLTPTRGCLTVQETPEKNEQMRLLKALEKHSVTSGYLLVMPAERVKLPD